MGKIVMGPKHKPAERTAIFEPTTKDLLTDEQKIQEATLKYNIGVLTKNKVQEQDMDATKAKQQTHERIMNEENKKYGEPLKDKTYRKVLKHLKKKNKKMFRHITKAGMDFQDAIFDYMADFIYHETVPERWNGIST